MTGMYWTWSRIILWRNFIRILQKIHLLTWRHCNKMCSIGYQIKPEGNCTDAVFPLLSSVLYGPFFPSSHNLKSRYTLSCCHLTDFPLTDPQFLKEFINLDVISVSVSWTAVHVSSHLMGCTTIELINKLHAELNSFLPFIINIASKNSFGQHKHKSFWRKLYLYLHGV